MAVGPARRQSQHTELATGLLYFPGSAWPGFAVSPEGSLREDRCPHGAEVDSPPQPEREPNPGVAAEGSGLMPEKRGLAQTSGRCPKGIHTRGRHDGHLAGARCSHALSPPCSSRPGPHPPPAGGAGGGAGRGRTLGGLRRRPRPGRGGACCPPARPFCGAGRGGRLRRGERTEVSARGQPPRSLPGLGFQPSAA